MTDRPLMLALKRFKSNHRTENLVFNYWTTIAGQLTSDEGLSIEEINSKPVTDVDYVTYKLAILINDDDLEELQNED